MDPMLTPPQVAKQLQVSRDKVLGWIRSGKLKAVNVSDKRQPRYRIPRKALEEFLTGREVYVAPPRRRRRKDFMDGVEEIF